MLLELTPDTIPLEISDASLILAEANFVEQLDIDSFNAMFTVSALIVQDTVSQIPVSDEKHPYHDRQHTVNVISAYCELAQLALKNGNITPTEFCLGIVATAFHDDDYDKDDKTYKGKNEHRSRLNSREAMSKYDVFTNEHIDIVDECIDATTFGGVAVDGSIIQKSSDLYVAKLVVDADVCNLSMPFEQAIQRYNAYYEELNDKKVDSSDNDYLDYLRFEIKTLRAHQYKSVEAQTLYGPRLEVNALRVEELLERLTN